MADRYDLQAAVEEFYEVLDSFEIKNKLEELVEAQQSLSNLASRAEKQMNKVRNKLREEKKYGIFYMNLYPSDITPVEYRSGADADLYTAHEAMAECMKINASININANARKFVYYPKEIA